MTASIHLINELRLIAAKAARISRWMRIKLLPMALAAVILAVALAVVAVGYLSDVVNVPSLHNVVVFGGFAVPAAVAAGFGSLCGINYLISKISGIGDRERRFLALRLPASTILSQWGGSMYNWLAGDAWMLKPKAESPFAYVHVFLAGAPAMSVAEEVEIWHRLGAVVPYPLQNFCLPGEVMRELQMVAALPSWSNKLDSAADGMAVGKMLGKAYQMWAEQFVQRARRRLSLHDDDVIELVLAFGQIDKRQSALLVIVIPTGEKLAAPVRKPVPALATV